MSGACGGNGVDRAAPNLLRSSRPALTTGGSGGDAPWSVPGYLSRVRRDVRDLVSMARTTLLRLLMLIALAAPVGTGTARAAQATNGTPFTPLSGTVVGTAGVNIRSCARVDCSVEAVAKLGESITVTGAPVDGFYPVDWGGLTGYAYYLFIATAENGPSELRLGTPGCRRLALIFNVGVGYETRMDVLDVLTTEHVPATIFPMGWWATAHPDLLKQMADAGFIIGNHGDQRLELTKRADRDVVKDIQASEAAIQAATGSSPERFFTPYAAATDDRVRRLIGSAGYVPVSWTAPADDWDFDATARQVHQNVLNRVEDGAIVELHLDAPATEQSTAIALPWIIGALRAKGYQFVTIPDLALPCP